MNSTPAPTASRVVLGTVSGRIALQTNRDGNLEVYVMNGDGSGLTNLTATTGGAQPVWSPDGSKILFANDRDGNDEIYVMNADGSGQTNLTDNPAAEDSFPVWSRDGKQIGFTSERDGRGEIYLMNADGSNPTRLTHDNAEDTFPHWSPEGKKIVYTSGLGGRKWDNILGNGSYEIYLMNADGSHQVQLTDTPGGMNDNMDPRLYKRFARLLLVCVILLSSGMAVRTVYAGQPVDPSTLNPPIPPEYNPVCEAVGSGTICTVSFTEYGEPGGTGVICGSGADSFEIMGDGGSRTVLGRRYYDQNNNLVMRRFHEVSVGTLTNPNTGDSLNTFQNDTVLHQLTVPGDISSGVLQISGTNQFSLPKGGTVLVDTGTTVLSAADESLVFESAHHPLDAFFSLGDVSAIQPICDALMK